MNRESVHLLKDKIKIIDKRGFVHEISISHYPLRGMSVAYDEFGSIIGSREYGQYTLPSGDKDSDWEAWEYRFREFSDGIVDDLERTSKEHFNSGKS